MSTELLNCDCMEYMATLEDNAFDLAIVDVPYGIGVSFEYKKPKKQLKGCTASSTSYEPFAGGDREPPAIEYFYNLFRVSENQIIWGANHFISRMPFDSSCWIVWDKQNGKSDFADCELAYTSFSSAVRIFRYMWAGMHQGGLGGDVRLNEKRIHPTQKPVKLYQWLLQNYAKPGQRILDTHLGSGSSAIAAHYFGCDFVGCELDKDYYDAACKRFKRETRQIAMF